MVGEEIKIKSQGEEKKRSKSDNPLVGNGNGGVQFGV
jgi:hypothetical protein